MSIIPHDNSAGSIAQKVALPHSLIFGEPFCDYLNISVPIDSGDLVLFELRPLIDIMGLSEVAPGLFRVGKDGGTFKYFKRGTVAIFSASGGLLESLRGLHKFADYLSVFSGFPHRVTLLHAAADFAVDGPPAIAKIYRHGRRGRVALTRKSILPSAVKSILSCDASGRSTGTIYFGHRQNADVWAKVYDKRHERISRGLSDPGPMVRVEIAVQSDVGATLQDAFNPTSLFFNFASPSLVEGPPRVPDWVPWGEGFKTTEREHEATVFERIRGIMDLSLDFARVCGLARDAFGDDAAKILSQMMRDRVAQKVAV